MLKFEKAADFKDVIYERSGYVARITLNRPEVLNTGVKDLDKAADMVAAADDIKVLIIKGAGRAFAAGAPLDQVGFVYKWKEPKPGEKAPRTPIRNRLKFDRNILYDTVAKWLFFPKITIVQAHGYMLGYMLDTMLACDFIIGTEDCKFGEIEVRLGTPILTITPLMILRCGFSRAMDLCLTGRMIDGKEAERIGLINRAVPADKLEEEVNRYAEGFAKFPFDGIAMGKLAKQIACDTMGISSSLTNSWFLHTLQTNMHFEDDEFSFFKARRDMGVRNAIHARNKFYELLDK
jgi:enoyl-CoA hydratase